MLTRAVVAAALCAAMLAAPAQAQSVKAGIEAWQRADYPAAVAIWRPLAEAGDSDAMFNLGQAFRLGRGVPINLGAAQAWLERAARKGHLDAQTTLGLLLFDNGNRAGGLRWLKAAAERGEARALLIYGTALFNGDGIARDPVLAYAYVSRAAAQGLAPAKATLEELDRLLPIEQRQQGIAMALAKVTAPVRKPPAASPATPPVAASAVASGAWRVQLGAFAQRSSAETLFKRLAATPALAGKQGYYVAAGAVTRLQAGPFASRAAASAACSALSSKGQPCFPVTAR